MFTPPSPMSSALRKKPLILPFVSFAANAG
jgi:hypothetical protein